MKRLLSFAAIIGLLFGTTAFAQNESAKREAAQRAAQSWLALVDHGDYGQSWQEAASSFQSSVSKTDWERDLQQVRTPLGEAGHRTLMGSIYQSDLPNAPKGEYVVIQYRTEFAGIGPAIETITPTLDKDGKWRVSGYFVKPAQ